MPRTFVWHPGRGPATTPKSELTTGMVEIRQVRSGIGHSWRMKQTLEAIGLRHHQDVVVKQDSPSLRGQIKRVRHLVEVRPVSQDEQQPQEGEQQQQRSARPQGGKNRGK